MVFVPIYLGVRAHLSRCRFLVPTAIARGSPVHGCLVYSLPGARRVGLRAGAHWRCAPSSPWPLKARAAQRAWWYLTRRVWQLLEAERRTVRLQQVLTPMNEIVAWTTILVRVPRNG